MGKITIVLIAILFIQYSKEASIATRKIGCTSSNCNDEDRSVRFDESTEVMKGGIGIDFSSSIQERPKRADCSSPMCWFRPGGKRESAIRPLNEKEGHDISCNSPMCWFRGKRGSRGMISKATNNAKWKKILQEIKALTERRVRRISKDGCDSPMCWFRPGREIQEFDYKRIMNYIRKVNAIKGAMKREMEQKYELRVGEKNV